MSLQLSSSNILVNKALICLVLAVLALANIGQVRAQEEQAKEEIFGAKDFRLHCAACHGPEGKGDGPVAQFMKNSPPDLTTLTKRHGGQFPLNYVVKVIDGREMLLAHGTREMPIWGMRYSEELAGQTLIEELVRGRILELVYYVQSIQSDNSKP